MGRFTQSNGRFIPTNYGNVQGHIRSRRVRTQRKAHGHNEKFAIKYRFRNVPFFLQFRKGIVEQFDTIFKGGDGENEQKNDYSEWAQFNKNWKWYHSIYRISNGNLLEFDRVTKIPIYKALTYLSYVTQKDKAETSERKRITRQAKAKN